MGCDIHMVLERKHNDAWIGVHAFPYLADTAVSQVRTGDENIGEYVSWRARHRNYAFFTELASVRGESDTAIERRGFPEDASALSRMEYEGWDMDAHSPTHVSTEEFASAYMRANPRYVLDNERLRLLEGETLVRAMERHLLGTEDEDGAHRVVIWFDN